MQHFHSSAKNKIHMHVQARKHKLYHFSDSTAKLYLHLKVELHDMKMHSKKRTHHNFNLIS